MTKLVLRLLTVFALSLFPLVLVAEEPAPEDVPLFSQAELDQMLAPVALYPDELLSQILMAATYPLEVVEAARFSRARPELKGQDAVRAAEKQSWDPSVKAMLAFPQVLFRMDEDLEWTRRLGDAFLAQQEQVMDTVQALRKRADEAGNLKETEHVRVVREERTIIVRNRYPDVVYVPYYDPVLIYGGWWWPDYQPVRWSPWTGYRYYSGYSGFFWGPSIVVGHGFFFGHYDWRDRYVRIVEAPPFYYRRPPPPRHRWEHEYQHRKGVPYRNQFVYDRYRDERDPVPRRQPRDYPEGAPRYTPPPAGDVKVPAVPGAEPVPPRGEREDGAVEGAHGKRDDSRAPRGRPEADDSRAPPPPPAPSQPVTGTTLPASAPLPAPGAVPSAPDYGKPAKPQRPDRTTAPEASGPDRENRADRPREYPAGSASRREEPGEAAAPRTDTPSYSAPRQSQPSYTPPPPRETPSYSAPRQSQPSYTPPPPRETPSYSAPRQSQPSYTPPPPREPAPQGSDERRGRGNRERPDETD